MALLSTHGADSSPPKPPLQLFDPSRPNPAGPSLREAYDLHVLPALQRDELKPRTLEEDRSALRKWETRTQNPGVLSPTPILTAAAAELRESLIDGGKHARTTIRKTFRHLKKIFKRLAPRKSDNPGGVGIIRRVPIFPTVKLPRTRRSGRRIIADDKFTATFLACAKATRLRQLGSSHRIASEDVWRAALVVAHFYGPRTGDLFAFTPESLILTPAHPDPDMPFVWNLGWICYVTEKTGVEVTLPLAPVVRRHLMLMLERGGDRLFPVPTSNKAFYEHWNVVKAESGAGVHFQEIRKTANTAWNRLWPGLGKFVLGHRPEGVNETYYSDSTQKVMDLITQFSYPSVFEDVRPRQRTLFGD